MSSASWKKKLFICVFAFQKKIIINKTFNRLDGPLILCPNDFDPAKNAKKTWRTSVVGEKTECRGFKMEFPCILQSSHIYAWTHIQKWRGKKHSYTRTRTTSTEEKQSERIIKLCCTPDLCSLTSLGMPDASRVYQQPACQQCWRSGSFLSPLTLQPGRHRQTGSGGVLWDTSKSYSSIKLKRWWILSKNCVILC